jgi:lipoprotein-releasing system permease protein
MYKLLLCWRYLRTRYIALVSIISVTLGVATMIVVNSVMAGFTHEMQNRIKGILSDLVFESHSLEGFHDPQFHMNEIRKVAGDKIAGMTPCVVVPALLSFRIGGNSNVRQVNLIGVDETTHSQVSDFGCYLQHPENRKKLSFNLHDGGYDTRDHQAGPEAKERPDMRPAGWEHRRWWAQREKAFEMPRQERLQAEDEIPTSSGDLFAGRSRDESTNESEQFDPETQQSIGIVLGMALASFRDKDGVDRFLARPGDDVQVSLLTGGTPPKITSDTFTIVDFYESKMSEYDSSFVFVPIDKLQELRGMINPSTGIGNVTSIQIKLKDPADGDTVRDRLKAVFPPQVYGIATWRDKQGPLLAAVSMETAILNVLLFLIIAVAGFGILAIFFMIVVEKTKDIGILKSLGAPARGVMGIFLAYGFSLGVVGAGAGVTAGILFVVYINEIAGLLGWITGRPVFNPQIYYFQEIPTIIEPFTVAWVAAGAVLIAIAASALPARRAARLHPVEALRYE